MIKERITQRFYKWQLLQGEQLFSRAPATTAGSPSAKFVHKRFKTKWRHLNIFSSPSVWTTAQESGAAAFAPSHGQNPSSHTYFLHIWNSTCRFGTRFFTVAAVSLIAITSSFCLSFKTCTYYEISKMRIFLVLNKMEMGRFGWQRWPWQSCMGAVSELCTRRN